MLSVNSWMLLPNPEQVKDVRYLYANDICSCSFKNGRTINNTTAKKENKAPFIVIEVANESIIELDKEVARLIKEEKKVN